MSVAPVEPTPVEPTPAASSAAVAPIESPEPDPVDLEGYRALAEKLRAEVKSVKADKTPQDEKDARAIAALKRQLAETKSPEDVRNELAQSIGKALGLVKDEPLDPAKLTEELTAEKTAAQQARIELAVFRAAGAANGDPAALLDSTSFLKSLDGIDPNDTAAVQVAIQSAVTANPRLGAAPADPRTPAPNPAQGSSAAGAPNLDAQIAAAQTAGDVDLAIHLQNQKLVTP